MLLATQTLPFTALACQLSVHQEIAFFCMKWDRLIDYYLFINILNVIIDDHNDDHNTAKKKKLS